LDKEQKILLFDTHAHYDDERFDEDRHQLIESLNAKGVGYVVNIAADMESAKKSIELAEKYSFIYAAVGVHPHSADEVNEKNLEILAEYARNSKVKAIGEIGLDYYYDNSPRDIQKRAFNMQLELASMLKLPVIIHDRDAHEDSMNIIKEKRASLSYGVFHCFSGSVEMAKELIEMDFYISVGGPLTFKNSRKLPDVVRYVPLDRLLIETDCPYLAPEPHRGKRNDSGYMYLVAQKIAEIKGLSFDEVAAATTDNAKKFFGI